eukprot:3457920-Rhodomonas_salina.3
MGYAATRLGPARVRGGGGQRTAGRLHYHLPGTWLSAYVLPMRWPVLSRRTVTVLDGTRTVTWY